MNPLATAILIAASISLSGCEREPVPLFVPGSTNYAVILRGDNNLLHQPGNEKLYYYPNGEAGKATLVWSYINGICQVAPGNLVIFNGGLSDSRRWRAYPALLAYAGTGSVVEISLSVSRIEGGETSALSNFALNVQPWVTNGIGIHAVERNGIQTLDFSIKASDILNIVSMAQTNVEALQYDGVQYRISK